METVVPYQCLRRLGYGAVSDSGRLDSVKDEWTCHADDFHVPLMLHPIRKGCSLSAAATAARGSGVCRHHCVTHVDLCDIDGQIKEFSPGNTPTKVAESSGFIMGSSVPLPGHVKDFYDVIIVTYPIHIGQEKAFCRTS